VPGFIESSAYSHLPLFVRRLLGFCGFRFLGGFGGLIEVGPFGRLGFGGPATGTLGGPAMGGVGFNRLFFLFGFLALLALSM